MVLQVAMQQPRGIDPINRRVLKDGIVNIRPERCFMKGSICGCSALRRPFNAKSIALITAVGLSASASGAIVIRVKAATLAGVFLQNSGGLPLDGGSVANGDGALLEFGYYSLATAAAPFAGQWNALTGPDSASLLSTTIGDGFSGTEGIFTFSFDLDGALTGLPALGTPLAIRFYDSTSRASSAAFNAVGNNTGLWNSNLSGSQIDMLVGDKPGIVWQGGAGSAYRTTIAVPETSTSLVVAGGMAMLALRRRRPGFKAI